MKKNDIATVRIEDIGVSGEGIGKVEGYPLFIKDAIIGDVVQVKVIKAKKSYGYARLIEIVKPSIHRVEPRCKVARQCGGCQIQEMEYGEQLRFKEKKVRDNLKRIGGFQHVPMLPIVRMDEPFRYRNKVQFPIGRDRDGHVVAGLYAGRTHQIIPNTDCLLGVTVNQEILECVLDFMRRYHVEPYDEKTLKGLVRHVLIRYGFRTKEILVCVVVNGEDIPHKEYLIKELMKIEGMKSISISVNKQNTNVIMGKEIRVLAGRGYIIDYIGDVKYQISPLSFYQVNSIQTEKLYNLVLEYAELGGDEVVWDIYCGIGTISLFLAQKARKVYGVEVVPEAIRDAEENARMNGTPNVQFFVGKAETVLPEQYEKNQIYADVIVVDPPRKGCEESVLETMVRMEPKRIVYVSCDSATLARDLKYLCEKGYELRKVRPVDQFGMSVHVECVALMSRRK